MGVTAAIVGTLASGFLAGRAQRQQLRAQARQEEMQARIAQRNMDESEAQAEQLRQNNVINEEVKRRRLMQREGEMRTRIGASGITATGSALTALMDNGYNVEQELAMDAYNDRQKVEALRSQSTNFLNERNMRQASAANFRKASSRAMMNSMLSSGFSLAANLYSPHSAGALKESGELDPYTITNAPAGPFRITNTLNTGKMELGKAPRWAGGVHNIATGGSKLWRW